MVVNQLDPLVVATLGFDPAAVAFSNYRSSYSFARTEYFDSIGTPFISSSDLDFDYQAAEGEEPGAQVLVVPHLDPGFVSYGPADPRILRLMLLTWIRTFVLIDCCYEELADPETPAERGTLDFCQRALNRLTEREQESGFGIRFAASKTAVQEYLHERGRSQRAAGVRRAEIRGDPEPGLPLAQVSANMSQALQAKVNRYGMAAGAPNSQIRLDQVRTLERHRYPEMRKLPSFQAHMAAAVDDRPNSEWRTWFLNMAQGTSIFQSIVSRHRYEAGDVIPGLNRAQSVAVMRIQEPPSTWQGTGNDWRTDPEMALLALSEHMGRMAGNRDSRGPISDQTRERLRQASLSIENRDLEVVDVFSNTLVYVSGSGRCTFSVYTGDNQTQQVSDPTGLWFGLPYRNQRFLLDYYPTISRHAVVVKDLDGSTILENDEPKLFYDWYFLWHTPQTYYKAFERTVLDTGNVLRFEVLAELALPDDERFSFNRLLLLLFQRMMEFQEQAETFTICSVDDVPSPDRRGNPIPIGFRQAIRDIVDEVGYRGIENFVWEHHLDGDIRPVTRAMRQLAQVAVSPKRSHMAGDHQVAFYIWTITPNAQALQQIQ